MDSIIKAVVPNSINEYIDLLTVMLHVLLASFLPEFDQTLLSSHHKLKDSSMCHVVIAHFKPTYIQYSQKWFFCLQNTENPQADHLPHHLQSLFFIDVEPGSHSWLCNSVLIVGLSILLWLSDIPYFCIWNFCWFHRGLWLEMFFYVSQICRRALRSGVCPWSDTPLCTEMAFVSFALLGV